MTASVVAKAQSTRAYLYANRHVVLVLSVFISLCVGVIYLTIAANRLTDANFGSDAGDFLAAVLTKGIPHPTGYPTYILLGILFQYLPINTNVFRGVLESLIPAALAAGLLTAWVAYVSGGQTNSRLLAGAIAGFAWGVAPLLFSQAVIVEVHGLQSLFVVVFLWWVTLNLQPVSSPGRKWLLFLSFLIGIGLGNHVTLALLVPVAILGLIYLAVQTRDWKFVLAQLGLIMAGLAVYLYLPLRARAYPPVNWGNPQTLSGFLWEVTANPYRQLVFDVHLSTIVDRLRSVASLLLDQFGPVGLVAGVLGLIHYSIKNKWLRWVLAWIFVVYFVFSIGYNTQDSIGYLIPAIMVYAIWISQAIPATSDIKIKSLPLGAVLIGVLVITIVARVPSTRSRLDPRAQDQPARFAEQFLADAPKGAIVYASTDQDAFPLWYYHFGLGERNDLRIIVPSLTQFVWYQQTLVHTYPDLSFPPLFTQDTPSSEWAKQVQSLNPGRPVCHTRVSPDSETGIDYQCENP